ncbi:cytochrome b [Methylophilus sp. QUAN]|uniref:cytochrome b n=1 Tax=Methylophilus sp. QUAN TaxID=2781020 RepID=UPI00188F1851|nr:cytochrome b/b6 domain-containing protein [Methylophilus sp. QUAN]MBF4991850.1 cytochrome b [Methylophilus sp. QUAN]
MTTSYRYGTGVQAFHWLTVILVLTAYVVSEGDGYSLYSPAADGLRRIHETLGLFVFIVVMLRLLWGLIDKTPKKRPMQRWMAVAASFVKLTLYALLLSIPATAVLGTWLEGIPVTLLGLDIDPQFTRAKESGQLIMNIHSILANVIIWVAGAHAAAALFHHFYLRDEVFQSMIPGRLTNLTEAVRRSTTKSNSVS